MNPESALETLGQQLKSAVAAQIHLPSGASTELAFLPAAVPVSPDTFLADGVVNPMLTAQWLNAVADTTPPIIDGQVAPTMSTASELMRSVALFAEPTAPVGSAAADLIGRLKDLASAATAPGVKDIEAFPTNWPATPQTPPWVPFSASSATAPTPPANGGPAPIWRWRVIDPVSPLMIHPNLSAAAVVSRHPTRAQAVAAGPTVTSGPALLRTSSWVHVADAEPVNVKAAVAVNPAIAFSAANATVLRHFVLPDVFTAPVTASSLTMEAQFLVVTLTRSGWWSSQLIDAPGWYFPGQRAGSAVPGTLPADTKLGVPISLVLTNGVTISGTWSDADRVAATNSTHLGPWLLRQNTQLTGTSSSATLAIPGIQLIAGLYANLPALPPCDDPALPAPQPTVQSGA